MTNESSLFECTPNEERKENGDKFQVYEEVKKDKLGDKIKENLYKKTETIEPNEDNPNKTIIENFALTGKIDLMQLKRAQEIDPRTGKSKIEFLPIKRNREIILPPDIAQMLIASGKLDEMEPDEIIEKLNELIPVYEQGVAKDDQIIEDWGGLEECQKKVAFLYGTHEKYISHEWRECGPDNWYDAVIKAQDLFGIEPTRRPGGVPGLRKIWWSSDQERITGYDKKHQCYTGYRVYEYSPAQKKEKGF